MVLNVFHSNVGFQSIYDMCANSYFGHLIYRFKIVHLNVCHQNDQRYFVDELTFFVLFFYYMLKTVCYFMLK